jgi:hypothetical protein
MAIIEEKVQYSAVQLVFAKNVYTCRFSSKTNNLPSSNGTSYTYWLLEVCKKFHFGACTKVGQFDFINHKSRKKKYNFFFFQHVAY